MIIFKNQSTDMPYYLLYKKYIEAIELNQKNVEAVSIASFNKDKNEVDSRYVNLKYIDGNHLIFFSNYNSSKSLDFESHNQVTCLIYWNVINTQIRIKAKIKKTSREFNLEYFKGRSVDKNALSISSNQSRVIKSYKEIINKYKKVKASENLLECPEYWGGYSLLPYYFEFWEGNESRINKRLVYDKVDEDWTSYVLEP